MYGFLSRLIGGMSSNVVPAASSISALGLLQRPVGTTAVRTLESLPDPLPDPARMAGELDFRTDLLIEPGHRFRFLDGLLTNFHLPRSTLLALVAAVVGLDRMHALYREAINQRYRFFSYGDAMLILGTPRG